MRSFVAVDLPYPRELEALAGPAPSHFHLTLRFFEELSDERVEAVRHAIERTATASPAFDLVLHGTGAFPSERAPRVVWVGVGAGADDCRGLSRRLDGELSQAGIGPEPRPFVPHATLRRIRGPRDLTWATRVLREGAGRTFGGSRVGALVLYASERRPSGALHRLVAEAPLSAPP